MATHLNDLTSLAAAWTIKRQNVTFVIAAEIRSIQRKRPGRVTRWVDDDGHKPVDTIRAVAGIRTFLLPAVWWRAPLLIPLLGAISLQSVL